MHRRQIGLVHASENKLNTICLQVFLINQQRCAIFLELISFPIIGDITILWFNTRCICHLRSLIHWPGSWVLGICPKGLKVRCQMVLWTQFAIPSSSYSFGFTRMRHYCVPQNVREPIPTVPMYGHDNPIHVQWLYCGLSFHFNLCCRPPIDCIYTYIRFIDLHVRASDMISCKCVFHLRNWHQRVPRCHGHWELSHI